MLKSRICQWTLIWIVFVTLFSSPTARGEERPLNRPQGTVSGETETSYGGAGGACSRGELRLAVSVSGMGTMDPHFAAGSQDRMVADMVFNGLLRYKPGEAPKIEPDLAESIPEPRMVGGKEVWTFKLRKGVMFHPGPGTESYELTADDAVFSLRKSADPAHSTYAGEYAGMTFEKLDTYTVRITLDEPISPILFLPKIADYAGGFIVSKRAVEAMGYEAFKSHPVGTGPFMFESYDPGRDLRLKAYKRYFRGRPLLEGVEIRFIPSMKKRWAGLLAGDLDVIAGSGGKGWLEKMERVPHIRLDLFGVGEVVTLYLDTSSKPLNDIRVRRAIAYALDRKAFLREVSGRLIEAAYSPIAAQFLPGGMDEKEVTRLHLDYAVNLKKARQLMTEAGYKDGFSLNLVSSIKRIYRTDYEIMRGQLARIGIDCHIRIVPHATMHKLIRQGGYPLVLYGAWRPNADAYLTRFFHSDSIVATGAKPDTNFSHYDKIDRLIEAARLEINPQKQINLWKQAQIMILNDVAAYPLTLGKQLYARRDCVDWGHPVKESMALYPQITEKTRFILGHGVEK
jgi:peptide/nickel transport system substrate-binding protein